MITTKDSMWINNGEEAKFINKNEPIPQGWTKGRLKSHFNIEKSNKTKREKQYHHYTDGVKNFMLSEKDEIPEGLIKGRPKASDEAKKKMSKSHTGKHHSEETKKKISKNSNNNRAKANTTIIEKYGSLENYYSQLIKKGVQTKKKNKTFNSSKPEDDLYKVLCEEYGEKNVYRHYKSKEYPYYCDFYIKPLRQYIELNLHWTHGSQPYVEQDDFCKKQLQEWQEKAKVSQFYKNAIETWTKRDVEKLNCAINNHLNYKVIY